MIRFRWTAVLLAAGSLASAGAATAQEAIVGVLEERPGVYDGERPTRVVRAVFHKPAGGAWTAYDASCLQQRCYPAETAWTVGFDGRVLGRVTGRAPATWEFSADAGRQSIVGGGAVPIAGARGNDFAGFTGGPLHRPLVTSSTGRVSDPETWRRQALPAATAAAVRAHFRTRFPQAERCASETENVARPWAYAATDIVVDGAYVAANGWRIAQASLPMSQYRCDGPVEDGGDGPFTPQTVAISPTGALTPLGAGMRLVDAGDYDGDGASELIFFFSLYNNDGYRLFSRNFAETASFSFSYH